MSLLKRSNTAILTLSGLLAGVVIGFGISLLIFEKQLDDIARVDYAEKDTTAIYDENKYDEISKKRIKVNRESRDTSSASKIIITDSDTVKQPVIDTVKPVIDESAEVVLRDEMISARSIKVFNLDTKDITDNNADKIQDSLITELTAVKPSLKKPQEYKVEFWVNPVNYRGYKIIRERIVLFGLPPEKEYTLYYNNGMLVMETENTQYHLREFSGFLPLIPQN